jgi:hypothetical protein
MNPLLIVAPQLSSGWQHNYSTKTLNKAGRPCHIYYIMLMIDSNQAVAGNITTQPKQGKQVMQYLLSHANGFFCSKRVTFVCLSVAPSTIF